MRLLLLLLLVSVTVIAHSQVLHASITKKETPIKNPLKVAEKSDVKVENKIASQATAATIDDLAKEMNILKQLIIQLQISNFLRESALQNELTTATKNNSKRALVLINPAEYLFEY